jgi:hypothetical protein
MILRVVFFLFRARAVQLGDFPDSESNNIFQGIKFHEPGEAWPFWHAFWECFKGFGANKAHADLWLNFFIGFAELAAYPILMKTGFLSTIAAWLALRTAGSWSGWRVSRTSFNRFLFNNICELAIAYFLLTRFVQAR